MLLEEAKNNWIKLTSEREGLPFIYWASSNLEDGYICFASAFSPWAGECILPFWYIVYLRTKLIFERVSIKKSKKYKKELIINLYHTGHPQSDHEKLFKNIFNYFMATNAPVYLYKDLEYLLKGSKNECH